ncbi:MAG: hypothetical protein WBN72_10925 [Nitrososphaeraceae archaeon]|jgi:hypothetical protein
MNNKNKIKIVLFSLIVAIGIATTSVIKVNALDNDEVILCVSVLETERDNDVNCHIYDMKDVDMSDHKFVKNLFSHDNSTEPHYPNLNFEKVRLLLD